MNLMIQPNQICLIVKLYNNRPELLPDSNDTEPININAPVLVYKYLIMKRLLLFILMFAGLQTFSGSLYANHPDSLQVSRQNVKVRDCKVRYQGEVAYEFNQLFDDLAFGMAGFTTTHGVRIKEKLFVGVGTGIFSFFDMGL